LVHKNEESLGVGNRSLCIIFERYARIRWNEPGNELEPPEEVVCAYLNKGGAPQIRATLAKIDLYRVAEGGVREESKYLAEAWSKLSEVGHRIQRCAASDQPPWAGNAAAAAFACLTLAQLDMRDAWDHAAQLVREQWTYEDLDRPPVPTGQQGQGPDQDAFDRMRDAMSAEDDAPTGMAPPGEAAATLDVDRAYRTWMLGILLSFEGTAPHADRERIRMLREIAARIQLADGGFYPQRLPWITAALVRGLCRTGCSYRSDPVVTAACDWLRRPAARGGPYRNGWESGAGSWATNGMAVANCVTALLKAGMPGNGECVRAGCGYLIAGQSQWAGQGREIDLALALEALLLGEPVHILNGRQEPDIGWRDQILTLLDWLREHALLSEQVTAHAPPANGIDEQTKVLLVSAVLVTIVWEIVLRELRGLLEDMVGAGRATLDPALAAGKAVGAALAEPAPAGLQGPGTGFTPLSLSELRERIADVIEKLQADIASQNRALLAVKRNDVITAFRKKRAELVTKQERCQRIAAQLTEDTPQHLRMELDTLGREVLGNAWEPIFSETKESR
jgi:hypothetical protein